MGQPTRPGLRTWRTPSPPLEGPPGLWAWGAPPQAPLPRGAQRGTPWGCRTSVPAQPSGQDHPRPGCAQGPHSHSRPGAAPSPHSGDDPRRLPPVTGVRPGRATTAICLWKQLSWNLSKYSISQWFPMCQFGFKNYDTQIRVQIQNFYKVNHLQVF